MLMQLSPPLPLETPKGKAWAVAMIDYGPQWDLQWVTFLHETGECWTFLNSDIRQEANYTFGLGKPSEIQHVQARSPVNGHKHNGHNGNGHRAPLMRPESNKAEYAPYS